MLINTPKRLTILRTSSGSPPSVSQIRKFQEQGLRVVALDSDPLSVGFVFADAGYRVPMANSPDYLDTLLTICERERVDWFLPSLDEELVLLANARGRFESIGTRLLLSGSEALRIATDKLATFHFFGLHGIPTPQTLSGADVKGPDSIDSYPQIIKPRFGRGSAGMFVARNWEETAFFLERVERPIVQSFIEGVEFTVDVLADFHGNPLIIAPRRRLATESGISFKGSSTWHDEIVELASTIVGALQLIGPANIQCFLNSAGEVFVTEINARMAGSCILTMAAGVPLMEGIVSLLQGEDPPPYLRPPEELVMLRYWSEVYLTPSDAAALACSVALDVMDPHVPGQAP